MKPMRSPEPTLSTKGWRRRCGTRDIGRALRTVNAVQAGVVWVNNHMAVGPEGPLGGYKGSGYGREGGTAGLEEFTQLKQVIVNLS